MNKILQSQFSLTAVPASAWMQFAQYHYRSCRLTFPDKIFAYKHTSGVLAAIIVYGFPHANNNTRNKVLAYRYDRFPSQLKLSVLNHDLRTITRVVVKPEFRGISLAATLVKHTIPLLPFRFIEAAAAMAKINSFFHTAGMTQYTTVTTSEKQTMHNLLKSINVNIYSDINTIINVLHNHMHSKQMSIINKFHQFTTHYNRAVRKLSPAKSLLPIYINSIRTNLTTTTYYLHDKANYNVPP